MMQSLNSLLIGALIATNVFMYQQLQAVKLTADSSDAVLTKFVPDTVKQVNSMTEVLGQIRMMMQGGPGPRSGKVE